MPVTRNFNTLILARDNKLIAFKGSQQVSFRSDHHQSDHGVSTQQFRQSSVDVRGPEVVYFWDKLKKCFGSLKSEKKKGGKKAKKQSCKKKKGGKKKDTCLKKKDECDQSGGKKEVCKTTETKKDEKKVEPCKKKEEKKVIKKEDPCKKKEEKKDVKKEDPCKKKEVKKEDPCKKKEEKKEDPCKKKEVKKEDPCKKEVKKEDPCKKEVKKEDPCKKKEEKKEDPCKKKEVKKEDPCKKKEVKKEDPCKKKEDPCKKKEEKKEDPCKKKEDPCKKKEVKKEDPCKKKEEKKEDPCKKKEEKKEDPCKKKEEKKEDPCKKKEDPCKKQIEKKEDPCEPCNKKEGKDPCLKVVPNISPSHSFLLFSSFDSIRKNEDDNCHKCCSDTSAANVRDLVTGKDVTCNAIIPIGQFSSILNFQTHDYTRKFANARGSSPVPPSRATNARKPVTQQAIPGTEPPVAQNYSEKVSGILEKLKAFWQGAAPSPREGSKQTDKSRPQPRTTGKRLFEVSEIEPTIARDGCVVAAETLESISARGDSHIFFVLDDFEKCEDRIPPCPLEPETFPCPAPAEGCTKTTDDIFSDIDANWGYEKFPWKSDVVKEERLDEVSQRSDDPYANNQL